MSTASRWDAIFVRSFTSVLESCDVMVTLIGPDWLDAADPSGNRRLESPTDFVRQEIAAALKRNIPGDSRSWSRALGCPVSEQLPDDLRDLPYRNGFELGHTTWESDVAEMVKRLGLQEQRPGASVPPSPDVKARVEGSTVPRSLPLKVAAIAGIIAIAGLVAYFYSQRSAVETIAAPEPVADGRAPTTGGAPSTGSAAPSTAVSEPSGAQRRLPRPTVVSPRALSNSTGQVVTAGTSFAESSWSRINVAPTNRRSVPARTP
jgi:hypothetical protein